MSIEEEEPRTEQETHPADEIHAITDRWVQGSPCVLQGLYYAAKLSPDDLQKAFGYFNQATQRDPTLGVAYAGLAESYSWVAGYR